MCVISVDLLITLLKTVNKRTLLKKVGHFFYIGKPGIYGMNFKHSLTCALALTMMCTFKLFHGLSSDIITCCSMKVLHSKPFHTSNNYDYIFLMSNEAQFYIQVSVSVCKSSVSKLSFYCYTNF